MSASRIKEFLLFQIIRIRICAVGAVASGLVMTAGITLGLIFQLQIAIAAVGLFKAAAALLIGGILLIESARWGERLALKMGLLSPIDRSTAFESWFVGVAPLDYDFPHATRIPG